MDERLSIPILKYKLTTTENITMRRLCNDTLGPYHENAADLAIKLEQMIVDDLPQSMYTK